MKAANRDRFEGMTCKQLVEFIIPYPGLSQFEWFQFWGPKWAASPRRQAMSLLAQGAYINAIVRAWASRDCGLPTDQEELRIMCGATKDDWSKISYEVINMFDAVDDRLYSHRLLVIRAMSITEALATSTRNTKAWKTRKKSKSYKAMVTNGDESSRMVTNGDESYKDKDKDKDKDKHIPPIPPRGGVVGVQADPQEFEAFWSMYPRKTAKGTALKAWLRLKSRAAVLSQIRDALKWQVRSEQWTKDGGQFVPHPATYLNQRRWEDVNQAASADQPQSPGPAYHRPFPEMTADEKEALRERQTRLSAAGATA